VNHGVGDVCKKQAGHRHLRAKAAQVLAVFQARRIFSGQLFGPGKSLPEDGPHILQLAPGDGLHISNLLRVQRHLAPDVPFVDAWSLQKHEVLGPAFSQCDINPQRVSDLSQGLFVPGEPTERRRQIAMSQSQPQLEFGPIGVFGHELQSDGESLLVLLQGTLRVSDVQQRIAHQRMASGQIVLPLCVGRIPISQTSGHVLGHAEYSDGHPGSTVGREELLRQFQSVGEIAHQQLQAVEGSLAHVRLLAFFSQRPSDLEVAVQ
jgi:hypothetical protein